MRYEVFKADNSTFARLALPTATFIVIWLGVIIPTLHLTDEGFHWDWAPAEILPRRVPDCKQPASLEPWGCGHLNEVVAVQVAVAKAGLVTCS